MVSPAEVITQPKDHCTDVKPVTFFLLRLSPKNPYCLWLSSNIKKLKNPMNLLPQAAFRSLYIPQSDAGFKAKVEIRLVQKAEKA
ncbi:MAG: hypothetical protein JKY64_01220 [Alcanivorax sp.]|nr:hypothetical protein [Alcanivorax sp.]